MQNQLDQILGTDFRGWADVISFQFFLRLLSQTPTESHGLGVERCKPRFCERELRRSCDWELIPLRFLMRRKREFSDEKPEREWRTKRKGGKRKKVIFFIQLVIILRENIVWSCCSFCYSALFFNGATVATLKETEFGEAFGVHFLCVCSPKLELVGDALRIILTVLLCKIWYGIIF